MFKIDTVRAFLRKIAIATFATLCVSSAMGQQVNPGVQQSGSVTSGNPVMWGPGVGQIQDSGAIATLLNAACLISPSSCAGFFGYYNPLWFGAKCDGTTNDSVALNLTITAARQKTILFPQSKTCVGHVYMCSTATCVNYAGLTLGGSIPAIIDFNGSIIKADSSTFPTVYIEDSEARSLLIANLNADAANLSPYGLRIFGCFYCVIDNSATNRATAANCSFEGTVGYGFYNNTIRATACGGSFSTGFTLNTVNFTGTITTSVLTVTGASSSGIAVGMGVGGNVNIASGTKITGFLTGTGGNGTYSVNVSQSVVNEAMFAQNLASQGNGIQIYTMNAGSPGCLAATSYNAGNTFDGLSSQFNQGRGWDINCSHNKHAGAEAEGNFGSGIVINGIYRTSDWFGGYTENNGVAWGGSGVSGDTSFFNPNNLAGIKIYGGVHNGELNGVNAANGDQVEVSGVTGYGFTANCNGSGHSCVTVP